MDTKKLLAISKKARQERKQEKEKIFICININQKNMP